MPNANTLLTVVSACAPLACSTAHAAITVSRGGVSGPPETVGGRVMTPYDEHDPRFGVGVIAEALDAWADATPSHVTTFGGASFRHLTAGISWAPGWGLGYHGSVYYTNGATVADLQLSPDTKGFYFYIQPNLFEAHAFTVTATGADGSTHSAGGIADGTGNAALWTVDAIGTSITNIEIRSDAGIDFAVGRFGYNLVPTPGALAILGLAAFPGRRRRD